MKKFVLGLISILFSITNAQAEIYHGIDIDEVYSQSDWSSKDKIKEIIDDYTIWLQYNNEFTSCAKSDTQIDCMDELAENIMLRFYTSNYENNINDYRNYVKSTLTVYGIVYCLNKYNIPSGNTCEQEKNAHAIKLIKQYIKTMLLQIENKIRVFSFIKDYK